jgi:hypothetical protein
MKKEEPKEKLYISRKVNIGSIQLPPPTATRRYWKKTTTSNSRKLASWPREHAETSTNLRKWCHNYLTSHAATRVNSRKTIQA